MLGVGVLVGIGVAVACGVAVGADVAHFVQSAGYLTGGKHNAAVGNEVFYSIANLIGDLGDAG